MVRCIIAAIACIAINASAVEYNWKVLRVIDGDTVEVEASWVPDPMPKKMKIRVFGVDTPESGFRAKCDYEKSSAALAKRFTQQQISMAKTIVIVPTGWDKYGGRILGDIIVDGNSLRYLLISNGHAREYFGDKKLTWCK